RVPRSGTYEPAPATSRGQGLMRVLINTKNRGANAVARPAKGSNAPGYLLATGDSTSPPDQLDVFGVTTSASAFPTTIAWRHVAAVAQPRRSDLRTQFMLAD